MGVGEAFAQFLNNLGDSTKIVVANVKAAAGFETRIQPSQIITAGPLKLGVTAVIEPDLLTKLADPDKADLLPSIKRPDEVLGKVLTDLEPKSDYQVLLVQGHPDLARRLATSFPGFDVVVASSETADPLDRDPVLLNGGKTMLVTVGRQEDVGAVGFFADDARQDAVLPGQLEQPLRPRRFADEESDPGRVPQHAQGRGVVENFPRHDYTGGPTGASFVGAETCKQCHPNTYKHWASTKHAEAFGSLEHDPKPNAIFDAECITCHTVGFEYTSGYRSAAATPQLKGVQCENCHGPASKHLSEPDRLEFRKPLKVTMAQAEKGLLCSRCHDEDNSPNFNFTNYWEKVRHNGLDEYSDPKVHQGVSPKVASKPDAATDK